VLFQYVKCAAPVGAKRKRVEAAFIIEMKAAPVVENSDPHFLL